MNSTSVLPCFTEDLLKSGHVAPPPHQKGVPQRARSFASYTASDRTSWEKSVRGAPKKGRSKTAESRENLAEVGCPGAEGRSLGMKIVG